MPAAATTPVTIKKKSSQPQTRPGKMAATKTEIKYTDKSAEQPELVPIFESLKQLMLPYVKGTIQMAGGDGGQMSLVSKKAIEIEGRKKEEMWFAGLLVQKGYVGFYFMPVYCIKEIKSIIQPELLKCLKGKACFHINKADLAIYAQIADALKNGYEVYKQKGWV